MMRPEFLVQSVTDIASIRQHAELSYRLQRELLIAQILSSSKYSDPRHLAHYEAQVYSQHGEDGIISEIFRRIGTTTKTFVEIGIEDGRECNTVYLMSQGWTGVWVEANREYINAAANWTLNASELHSRLKLIEARMTVENAPVYVDMIVRHLKGSQPDLLSIDIDQNTSHVWRALSSLKPRVAVIEYNASIPRDDEWEVEYDPERDWDGSNYFGASLGTLVSIGRERGMMLVGCDLSGSNAFFVRRDLTGGGADGPWRPSFWSDLWEPPRYFLLGPRGHRPQYGRSAG